MPELTANQVADYILSCANEAEELITNLKVQKLLYYAQGYYLAIHHNLLFDDEIQAWIHGPVIPNIYHRYKDSRWRPIDTEVIPPKIEPTIAEFLDLIIETFLPIDAYKLELMTHNEPPWIIARRGLPKDAICRNAISTGDMRAYFGSLMASDD